MAFDVRRFAAASGREPEASLCSACEAAERLARRWDTARGDDLRRLCAAVGVGSRFIRGDKPPSLDDAGLRERIAARPLPMSGLYVCGPCGSHKSHLLAARVVEWARCGIGSRLVNWPALALEVRNSYRPGAEQSEADLIERVVSLEYAAIDDLGVGRADKSETDAALRLAYALLNARYERSDFRTDIASNLTPAELAERFDERIARRIGEMCTTYPMLLETADKRGR